MIERRISRLAWVASIAVLAAASVATAHDFGPGEVDPDERIAQQDRRIRELEERIEQLEAAMREMVKASTPQDGVAEEADEDVRVAESVESADPVAQAESEGLVGDVRERHRLLTRDELESDDFPGSWPMFGTNTRLKLGGYVKADFVADFDGTLDSTQFLVRTIPIEGTPEYGGDPYVDFFARETRFNLDYRRVAPGSPPLRGFIEGDFFSSGNNFRLRHAYVSAGNFIAGQTWTTLSFLEALPFVIDFAAGDALFGGRAVQLRYQRPVNTSWKLSVALEELQFLGIQNSDDLPGKATTQWPLAAFRADYRYGSGVVLLGTSVGQLHWDGGSSGPSDSARQVAVVAGGRQNIADRAYATWHLSYGEGSGENVMAFAGTDANAVLDADGRLETFPAFSTVLGFGYDWTPTWSSNLSYAYGWLDTPETRDPLLLKRGGIGHVNLIWKPKDKFSTGIEFMWGTTRVQNDATGDASRLQLMTKYEF